MEEKDNVIKIDKRELWEQIKKEAPTEPYSVKFEAVDINPEIGKTSCFVDVSEPLVTSNFQHAALFNGIFEWVAQYIDDIEDEEDFKDKYEALNEILEGLPKIFLANRKMLQRTAPDDIKDISKWFLDKLDNKGEEDE